MSCMSVVRSFVDTNILVYAYDTSAGEKHATAVQLLADLWRQRSGVISTQVLQEFFVTVTRKIPRPLAIPLARAIIEDLSRWEVVAPGPEAVLQAIDLQRDYQLSYWDAMILTTAHLGGAAVLLTEDLNPGQEIAGVIITNPFIQ